MIPDYDVNGNLPAGVHNARIDEVKARYATNELREKLMQGLLEVLEMLTECQCPEVHLDGSFITRNDAPGDYDLSYEPTGMVPTSQLEVFLRLTPEDRKARYLGDIFMELPTPPYYLSHATHWQTDSREDDVVKGIIRINLRL